MITPIAKQFDTIYHAKYGEGMVVYVKQRYKSNLYMVRFGKEMEFMVDKEIKDLLGAEKRKEEKEK
jgi:hypothetical protein